MQLVFLLFINSVFHSFLTETYLFDGGVVNICNTNFSNPNCKERTSDTTNSQYECTELLQSQSNTICGCSSLIEASVIIIIDASNHTREEWQYITLKWLQLYYNAINSLHGHDMKVYYMLSHGDFILNTLNVDPSQSNIATDSFMNSLNELSIPNACIAFKRANEWLSNQKDLNNNDTAIIYYSKATPFAPSYLYKCQSEDDPYKLIRGKDIFAIKYHENVNLKYVQRDIGEFAYETSIFPNQYNDIIITGTDNDYLIGPNNKTNEITSSIVAAVSDFVCTKGREKEKISSSEITTTTTPSLIVAPPSNKNLIDGGNDCCSHASGIEYDDIETCDTYKIREIEYTLSKHNCLRFCNPYYYYQPMNEDLFYYSSPNNKRNWDCITNYSLYVQLYHICSDLNQQTTLNATIWNDYRWHCPICYNISINTYKSICRSTDGKQDLLETYIAENCDCKDVTLFLVVIIEITALLCILIGMFILWFRFNIYKVNQHLREKRLTSIHSQVNHQEEIILNDINEQEDDDNDDT